MTHTMKELSKRNRNSSNENFGEKNVELDKQVEKSVISTN